MNEDGNLAVGDDRRGMSRRDALRKGAVAGGVVLWVTPLVQSVGMSPASAQTTSSPGDDLKNISFVEFRFTCTSGTFYVKVDNIQSATNFNCEFPRSSKARTCGVSKVNAQDGCGLFTLSDLVYDDDGDLVALTVNLTCDGANFEAGKSKCGQLCGDAAEAPSGTTAMFFGCS